MTRMTMLATLLTMMTMMTAAGAAAQAPELAPPWEAKVTIEQLRAKVARLSLALGDLQVLTWRGTGAENYLPVADSARRQVSGIGGALDRLALEPQKLSAAIHVFVAMQQVTGPLDSLTRGVTQFQGAESAREIEEATNAVLNDREKLTEYVLTMVRFIESSGAIAQRELDSCREQLWKRASEPQKSKVQGPKSKVRTRRAAQSDGWGGPEARAPSRSPVFGL